MSPQLNKPRILVVDDDESMRFVMHAKLAKAGFAVSLAASGTHAIQILEEGQDFDLVLCDLKMPTKDGVDVLRVLREKFKHTPAIIITAFPEKEKIIEAARIGVQDVLVKPVRQHELMQMINLKLGLESESASEKLAA